MNPKGVLSTCCMAIVALTSTASAQTTINFEDGTIRNMSEFSTMGSEWAGGIVRTEGILRLYSSGRFSYEIDSVLGTVTFETPVESVSFFYVHGDGFDAGVATAFDETDNTVGAPAGSNPGTTYGDIENFVVIRSGDGENPIARVEFTGGVIDDFSFPALVDDDGNPIRPGCAAGSIDGNYGTLESTLGDWGILSLTAIVLMVAGWRQRKRICHIANTRS